MCFPYAESGFAITLTMKRRYLYQLLTTYLPSLCLFFIIHATHYFKITYFHTRIMVSLTGECGIRAKNRFFVFHLMRWFE